MKKVSQRGGSGSAMFLSAMRRSKLMNGSGSPVSVSA
jgi:hypothetical protein